MTATTDQSRAGSFSALLAPAVPTPTFGVGSDDAGRRALPTTVVAFVAIALGQLLVVLAAPAIFDLPGLRAVLVCLAVASAALAVIVGAWDARELDSAGYRPPSPLWAVVPPVYLGLRRRAVGDGSSLGWAVMQGVLVLAIVVLAIAALVTAPAPSAGASDPVAAPTTPAEVADVVQQGWIDEGSTGTAACTGDEVLAAGAEVSCSGEVDGRAITFAASVGDVAAGEPAVTIASWTEAPLLP